MNLFKALFVAVVVLLSGCSSTPTSPEREIIYNIGARQVVFRHIAAGSTPTEQQGRAHRILQAVTAFRVLVDDEAAETTLSGLLLLAKAEIDRAELSPPDKDLLVSLVIGLEAYLKQRIDEGVLSPEARATVSQVLGWISDAAAAYPLAEPSK